MRFLSRIKRLELELRAQSPSGLAVVPVHFGESQEEARARYCKEKGISEEEAEGMSWIFITRFCDPNMSYPVAAKVATPKAAGDLDGEGYSVEEVADMVRGETPLALEPAPVEAPKRPRKGNGGAKKGLLQSPEELRADDLVKLFGKRRH